jgi:hypothetical protein
MSNLAYEIPENTITKEYVEARRAYKQIKDAQNRTEAVIRKMSSFGYQVAFVNKSEGVIAKNLALLDNSGISYNYNDNTSDGSTTLVIFRDISAVHDSIIENLSFEKAHMQASENDYRSGQLMYIMKKEIQFLSRVYKYGIYAVVSLYLFSAVLFGLGYLPFSSLILATIMSVLASGALYLDRKRLGN